MAVVWAKRAGNWDDATSWEFFNETTQQIEDYGRIPQNGDYVYLNGFNINGAQSIDLPLSTISNEINPYTSNSGGSVVFNISGYATERNFRFMEIRQLSTNILHVTSASGRIFNIYGSILLNDAPLIIIPSNGIVLTINGDINSTNDIILLTNTNLSSIKITVNGNITTNNKLIASTSVVLSELFINGNVNNTNISNGNITKLTINGNYNGMSLSTTITNLTINGSLSVNYGIITTTTTTINGNLYTYNSSCLRGTTLNIGGSIAYETNNGGVGVAYYTMNIQNPTTFTWKDLTEPRSNPFIILTDAEIANRQQYPAVTDVKKDVEYAWGALKGQLEQVQVGCVTKEDVREGVPLLGMGEVGTCAVPSPDDVREGVPVDNTIGTLIVQGGGDRLRIADFGYYTNAQSDTYIVDITEADKPKFASAEERILIEMFPSLDLDNIPQMYFDDLFVKYLKYRLIVEYYRTAGVNSTFTPSEPTTEIVNYRNVTCEVWLNSANIYLNAWNKKYDLNKPPKKVRL